LSFLSSSGGCFPSGLQGAEVLPARPHAPPVQRVLPFRTEVVRDGRFPPLDDPVPPVHQEDEAEVVGGPPIAPVLTGAGLDAGLQGAEALPARPHTPPVWRPTAPRRVVLDPRPHNRPVQRDALIASSRQQPPAEVGEDRTGDEESDEDIDVVNVSSDDSSTPPSPTAPSTSGPGSSARRPREVESDGEEVTAKRPRLSDDSDSDSDC
ncbi:hypothetical protein GBF38_009730, partial [Nibea albiflora]